MSAINVNSITGRTGTHGPVLTGVTTATNGLHVTSGNVGLGTSSPSSTLQVGLNPNSGTGAGVAAGSNGALKMARAADSDQLIEGFKVGTSPANFVVRADGSTGIGTSSPRSKLDIQGSDQELRIYRDDGTRFGGFRYTGAIFKLRLPTNDPFTVDDASDNERFRVNANGQVKIGGNTLVAPDADADNLIIDSGDADSGISILSATTGRIYFGDAGDHEAGSIRYVHTDNSMRFETANTERFRVGSAGSVHIGDDTSNANGHGLLSLTQSASAAFNALVIQQGNTAFTANDGLHIGIDGSVDSYIKTFENRDIYFTTGVTNAERFRINHDGNVNISDGNLVVASGHGIDFSATGDSSGSMTSELLDDYEEGTWEPTFTSTAGDFNSVTYHGDTGARYIKVGSLVTVNGCARCTAIDTSNIASGQTLCIGGLPFTNVARDNGDNADNIGSLRVPVWGNTNNCPHAIQARQNVTICTLLNYEIDAVTNTNIVSQANNSMMIQFSLQYTAA